MQPDDAMAMMRGLRVRGDDPAMRHYLKKNFENHPLLLGIVAGLITDYVRDPGNFDRWADDPQGGAALHLAKLDLVQRRTHILAAALNGLEPGVRQLLSRIAALPDAASFETVAALNPDTMPKLVAALQDLERRGLLQWDRQKNTYDLHPVVRGYAFDALEATERADICNRIVRHFQSKPADRYEGAKTLDDVQQSITIFRALVQANRPDDAVDFYRGGFSQALSFSLEALHEVLALLRPLFPDGFDRPPRGLRHPGDQSYVMNLAGLAFDDLNRFSDAERAFTAALGIYLNQSNGMYARTVLNNLGIIYESSNRLHRSLAARELALLIAEALRDLEAIARAQLDQMWACLTTGLCVKAEAAYEAFRQLPTPRNRGIYRPGDGEWHLCRLKFYQGTLTDALLSEAESVAWAGNSRFTFRNLCQLRGEFALLSGDAPAALASFERAIEMAQTAGLPIGSYEALLALAKAKAGFHAQAREVCARLDDSTSIHLAQAYLELGDQEKARCQALAAYKWAWAEGPPYSRWLELKQCREVLHALREPEPSLPPFDPKSIEPIPYEAEIRELIEKLKKP